MVLKWKTTLVIMARVVSLMEIQEQGGSMLVLSRREQEAIVIAGSIVVKVLEVRCGVVRLGIVADKDISVHREEIEEKIVRERRMLD
jgi:carbon storage regulator